jgi:endonuclease-8
VPEGDTIHNLARRLAPSLVGQRLEALLLRQRGEVTDLRGEQVQSVDALGKHLLFAIGPRWVLRVHLGMRGRFRQLATSAPWRDSARRATVALVTRQIVHLCHRASQAELVPRKRLALDPQLARLGPDLLGPEPDFDRVLRRARSGGARTIGDVLLDQRVACGLGNVYKSELCHLTAVNPWTPAGQLDDVTLTSLYRLGRQLLQRNVGPRTYRITRPAHPAAARQKRVRLWVYNRAGRPCYTCDEPIRSARQGDDARPTYWCPSCQPRPSLALRR